MQIHLFNIQLGRHQTGMLCTGTTKRIKHIIADIITALHRYFFHRRGHIIHRNAQKTGGYFFRRIFLTAVVADLYCKLAEFLPHNISIQWLILFRTKHMGKMLWL